MAQPVSDLADLVLLKPVEVEQLRTLAQRLDSFDVRPKHLAFRDPISELFTARVLRHTRLELAFARSPPHRLLFCRAGLHPPATGPARPGRQLPSCARLASACAAPCA